MIKAAMTCFAESQSQVDEAISKLQALKVSLDGKQKVRIRFAP